MSAIGRFVLNSIFRRSGKSPSALAGSRPFQTHFCKGLECRYTLKNSVDQVVGVIMIGGNDIDIARKI